jgi:elongation factor 2
MAKDMVEKVKTLMKQPKQIRNIAICAHIDHGKTTFSDNLLAGAGMLSEEHAGKQLALDFHEDEQARGITIDSSNVSMVHTINEEEFLINLIDTPGHVDFGGDVTRAMRAVDGAIVLCDAVEGIMPQTETVLRQALKEHVKPVLFINKVDRLIREVKLTPEAMRERFVKIIASVNSFIDKIVPEQHKGKWNVAVQDGSVCFGSAFHNWAMSLDYMQKKNLSFKDIIEHYQDESNDNKYKELAKKAPLHEVVLSAVVKHLPNPVEAQKYRIPEIWHGDIESPEGKAILNCDTNGEPTFVCIKIVIDPHMGEVAAGRMFSGTLKQGDEVYLNGAKKRVRIQQVSIYKGAQRIQMEEVIGGNIVGISGLKGVFAGETASKNVIEPFEAIKHIFEPVVTKSIEADKAADLPKLIEVLRKVSKEDPSILIEINEETGENLLHGMGELHLEVIENRIVSEKGVKVKTSPPIVIYRESVTKESPEVEGKSPNKHNKFYVIIEPLEGNILEAIKEGTIPEGKVKKNDKSLYNKFEALGIPVKEGKKIRDVCKGNLLVDGTRGIVHIGEVQELINQAFEQVMKEGPLAREPGIKMKVILKDTKLHEDAIHRGPAQVLPAVRSAIKQAMNKASPMIYEPMQIIQIDAPHDNMGDISGLISNKRGQLLEMNQEDDQISVKAKLPVAEMFGLSNELRSMTSGRGNYFLIDQAYEKLPHELQQKVVNSIRERKGLKPEDLKEEGQDE